MHQCVKKCICKCTWVISKILLNLNSHHKTANLQCVEVVLYFKSKEEGKDQESIQSNSTPDPGHHMGK